MQPVLQFSYLPPEVMHLEAASVLAKVMRYDADFPAFPAPDHAFFTALHRDLQAALRSNHPEKIYTDVLNVKTPHGYRSIAVDLRNTQFTGADRGLPRFRRGYEPDILLLLDAYLGDVDTFIDIGANWGYFPIYVACRPDFKGHCLAVEPSPRAYGDLANLVNHLGFNDRIKPARVAISDHRARVSMTDELWTGMNKITDLDSGEESASGLSSIPCVTLDHLVQTASVESISVLKVDVEGAEAAVFRGGLEAIPKCQPVIIFESWLDPDPAKTLEPFESLRKVDPGYEFYVVQLLVTDHAERISGVIARIDPADRLKLDARINVLALPRGQSLEPVARIAGI